MALTLRNTDSTSATLHGLNHTAARTCLVEPPATPRQGRSHASVVHIARLSCGTCRLQRLHSWRSDAAAGCAHLSIAALPI